MTDAPPKGNLWGTFNKVVLENGAFGAALPPGARGATALPGHQHLSQGISSVDEVDYSHRIYATPRLVRFNEMEYNIPAEHAQSVLAEIDECVNGASSRQLSGRVRFVRADDIWLSPAYQRASCYIAVHMYRQCPTKTTSRGSKRFSHAMTAGRTGASCIRATRRIWRPTIHAGVTSNACAMRSTRTASSSTTTCARSLAPAGRVNLSHDRTLGSLDWYHLNILRVGFPPETAHYYSRQSLRLPRHRSRGAPAQLRRGVLGLPHAIVISIAVMSPAASIFFNSPLANNSVSGAAMPLAFLLGFVVVLFVANQYSEFSRELPSSGSSYTFVSEGLGPRLGIPDRLGWTDRHRHRRAVFIRVHERVPAKLAHALVRSEHTLEHLLHRRDWHRFRYRVYRGCEPH